MLGAEGLLVTDLGYPEEELGRLLSVCAGMFLFVSFCFFLGFVLTGLQTDDSTFDSTKSIQHHRIQRRTDSNAAWPPPFILSTGTGHPRHIHRPPVDGCIYSTPG
jgi:hypothetical protein